MEVDRQRLRSLKGVKWSKYGPDVIPAWVADMDFSPSSRILSEIQKMVDLGDFGYRYHDVDLLIPAWCEWVEESHGWHPTNRRMSSIYFFYERIGSGDAFAYRAR